MAVAVQTVCKAVLIQSPFVGPVGAVSVEILPAARFRIVPAASCVRAHLTQEQGRRSCLVTGIDLDQHVAASANLPHVDIQEHAGGQLTHIGVILLPSLRSHVVTAYPGRHILCHQGSVIDLDRVITSPCYTGRPHGYIGTIGCVLAQQLQHLLHYSLQALTFQICHNAGHGKEALILLVNGSGDEINLHPVLLHIGQIV